MSNVYKHAIEALAAARTKMRQTAWDRQWAELNTEEELDRCALLRFVEALKEEFGE